MAPAPTLLHLVDSSIVPDQPSPLQLDALREGRSPGRPAPARIYGASDPAFFRNKRHPHAAGAVFQSSTLGYSDGLNHLARRSLAPTSSQKVTLGVIGAYIAGIAILWNIPYLKYVLWPFKMLTIAFHEFGHASTGCCTGAKIKSITLDPREGGCTMMAGGWPLLTLCSGYLGSSLIGAALLACGFNITASKVCSIVLGVGFLVTLWWSRKDWLTIVTILFAVALIVACWFIDHGAGLRWYILFVGVMSCLYSVWDIFDDLILRKVNESDASVFAKRYGGSSACWGCLWAIISIGFLAGGILVGLACFKTGGNSSSFLPTKL